MTPPLPDPLARAVSHVQALSADQRALRVLAALAPLGTLLCLRLAGGNWPVWVLLAVVALSAVAAVRPDSHVGVALLVLLGWRWFVGVGGASSPWVLAGALTVLLFHAATAAAAASPPGASLDPAIRARWLRRTAGVGAATAMVWGLTTGFRALGPSGNALATVAALAALTAGLLLVRRVTLRGEPPTQ